MAKRKLQRFAAIASFKNVFQHIQHRKQIEDFVLKGQWENYFNNKNPIVLELGCGKGEYTIGLAEEYPNKNFIGIDLKGNRIWRGAQTALDNNMTNVAFLRMRIENIATAFSENEISEIWITFPDPQPQISREKKRLTAVPFLQEYSKFLHQNGVIHLKTDSNPLYQYTLNLVEKECYQLIQSTENLYEQSTANLEEPIKNTLAIKTFYEEKFSNLGFKICYLQFTLQPLTGSNNLTTNATQKT